MEAAGSFTQKLWDSSLTIFNQIVGCDFLRKLTDGSLDKESFAHFLTQDILYLKKDADALGRLAKRADCEKEKKFFSELEHDGLEIEFILQDEYLTYYQLEAATSQSPAFEAYSEFLMKHSQESIYGNAIIALLPCFWLYSSMRIHTTDKMVDNNPYQKFIDTYAGDEYREYTKRFLQIVEKYGINCQNKATAIEIFKQGMQYELNLFVEAFEMGRSLKADRK
jgi:thiaminase/transcriptional activator TenA